MREQVFASKPGSQAGKQSEKKIEVRQALRGNVPELGEGTQETLRL